MVRLESVSRRHDAHVLYGDVKALGRLFKGRGLHSFLAKSTLQRQPSILVVLVHSQSGCTHPSTGHAHGHAGGSLAVASYEFRD